ncbi:MAG: hypothetical protein QNJ97_13765 [Myxococcota bacterium]|nr:hypothetical protein [Myxococcota bacterium]
MAKLSEIRLSLRLVNKYILICAVLVSWACSDAGLQLVPDPVVYVDDKLAVTGQVCTGPADEVSFPVKILIIMDQSASLQCTDPGNNRLTALNQACGALNSLPNVQYGVIGFASWSTITSFAGNWGVASEALAPESGQGGPATDYQGALSTALRVLEQDMIESGPAERSRTKYVVLFLSDGIPEPRCRAGCDDGDTTPDSLYGVCNTTQEIPDGVYVDMLSLCPDYNQPEQIVQKVQDIMSLGDYYGVGDLQLNAILLFASEAEIQAVCGDVSQFGYDKDEAVPLLRAMAEEGLGTFRDVHISAELDFLDFNYESLIAPYQAAEFFVVNLNTVPTEAGVGIDSDGDGLADDLEFAEGLNRLARDSDGDWFGDQFERKFAAKGFDPLDGSVPAMGCADRSDRDADGLLACEEAFLGTDPRLPDHDGDRIPDGIELRFGTDPAVHDTLIDHDFDGRLSGSEIRAGTSPILANEADALADQIYYSVDQGPMNVDDTRCYDFSVQEITLVPTLAIPDIPVSKGLNRVMIYTEEEPQNTTATRGRFNVACIHARYLGDTYKDPPSGLIPNFSALRFVELQEFNPATDCLGVGDDPSSLLDGGLPQ